MKTAAPIYDDVFMSFRSLCAFLNSGKCGTVYFGIRRDGVVAGLKIKRKQVSPGSLLFFLFVVDSFPVLWCLRDDENGWASIVFLLSFPLEEATVIWSLPRVSLLSIRPIIAFLTSFISARSITTWCWWHTEPIQPAIEASCLWSAFCTRGEKKWQWKVGLAMMTVMTHAPKN